MSVPFAAIGSSRSNSGNGRGSSSFLGVFLGGFFGSAILLFVGVGLLASSSYIQRNKFAQGLKNLQQKLNQFNSNSYQMTNLLWLMTADATGRVVVARGIYNLPPITIEVHPSLHNELSPAGSGSITDSALVLLQGQMVHPQYYGGAQGAPKVAPPPSAAFNELSIGIARGTNYQTPGFAVIDIDRQPSAPPMYSSTPGKTL